MLTIELVPSTSWFTNLRSILTEAEWNTVKKKCYRQANYRCEVCGGRGPEHPVECHEIWHYDEQKKVQSLTGLIALCPLCHSVKHMGLTTRRGLEKEAIAHLAKVNAWSPEQARQHVREAFAVWRNRSRHAWKVEVDYLHQYKA